MKLFISPHNDDETLFGAFTILRERPLVLIVYDSWIQFRRGDPITALNRRNESSAAMKILGAEVRFCGLSDEQLSIPDCEAALRPYTDSQRVWAPAFELNGNPHHNLVARVAELLFPKCQRYMTYTSAGKSLGIPVPIDAGWTLKKLQALACYESQSQLAATRDFFLNDQREYYLDRRVRRMFPKPIARLARHVRRMLAP